MTGPQGLNELARLYGIRTSYLDMKGRRRDADPEALVLVLRAMGAGVERFEDDLNRFHSHALVSANH